MIPEPKTAKLELRATGAQGPDWGFLLDALSIPRVLAGFLLCPAHCTLQLQELSQDTPPTHTHTLICPRHVTCRSQIQIGRDSGPFGMVDTIDIRAMLRMTTAWLRFEPVLLDSD